MKSGDFIYIDYVGRTKDSGEMFDLTKEDVAKKEKLFDPKIKYKPIPVIIDGNFVLPGLNDALKEMKVGEKKKIEIPPEKAFGERNPEFVKLIPESRFKEQDMEAKPSSFVTIRGIRGKVVSVSGGRVRVDFNHPLAGKTLEYDLEIVDKIEKQDEKIKAVFNYFTGMESEDIKVTVMEKKAEIEIKKRVDVPVRIKEQIAKTVIKWVKGIEKISFIETFEK